MKHLRPLNEDWYKDPSTFEKLPQIDVSLTDMRKKLLIKIGSEDAEFSKEEADALIKAITTARNKM